MKDFKLEFGHVIAFLLPGFICLYGLSLSIPEIATVGQATKGVEVTVGSFLFIVLSALALGLLLSALRWFLLDSLLKLTGVTDPGLKFENLKDEKTFTAFTAVVENHYRYYQYYGNSLIAILVAVCVYVAQGKWNSWGWGIGMTFVLLVLLVSARDCLKKYYDRAAAILT
jgi:hypothetical protein